MGSYISNRINDWRSGIVQGFGNAYDFIINPGSTYKNYVFVGFVSSIDMIIP